MQPSYLLQTGAEPQRAGMNREEVDKLAHQLVQSLDKDEILELSESLDNLYRLIRLQVH